ncbi:hypothetical protein E8K88_10890 [Lampropedia aestuarii]|uniref:Uncharacterized protein n=1 Tax=Lampropedia aestuarii TaxID=2562762 RepID=A0A4S5BKB3_9BURK|nr:hypothetical protein [Lampropedia aestuarii]MDH5858997.1 hypothetical protein [Lampropedia aestuarii]THJ32790.1 hypothetical protein E8K88_10890 [Lampropedia aestuarii]
MNTPNYTLSQRLAIAAKLGVDEQCLYQLGRGLRQVCLALARQIHAPDACMALQWRMPDDWQKNWPELHKEAVNG